MDGAARSDSGELDDLCEGAEMNGATRSNRLGTRRAAQSPSSDDDAALPAGQVALVTSEPTCGRRSAPFLHVLHGGEEER
jgi:hypothetical protein